MESVYKSRRSLSFVCRSFVLSFASPLKKFFRIQDVCYVTFPKDKSIQSCTLRSSKVLHKKRDKETVEKEKKNLVFNESNVVSYIQVCQLPCRGIINYPGAINKNIICPNNLILPNNTKCSTRNFRTIA